MASPGFLYLPGHGWRWLRSSCKPWSLHSIWRHKCELASEKTKHHGYPTRYSRPGIKLVTEQDCICEDRHGLFTVLWCEGRNSLGLSSRVDYYCIRNRILKMPKNVLFDYDQDIKFLVLFYTSTAFPPRPFFVHCVFDLKKHMTQFWKLYDVFRELCMNKI